MRREREEPPTLAHLFLERAPERHVARRDVGEDEDEEGAEEEDEQTDPVPRMNRRSVFALGILRAALELEARLRLGRWIARHGEPSRSSVGVSASDHYEASTGEDGSLELRCRNGRSSKGIESAIVVFVVTPAFSRSRLIRSSRSPVVLVRTLST